jgi:prepilin-type N-terminal cleavage/methylation domain-containing protein
MNKRLKIGGFTLVEILVVVVIGSLVLIASFQVLVTNTRLFALNGARVQGQQTLRGALDLLSGELREISTRGGDLVEMGADSLTIRAQRAFGVVCGVNYNAAPAEITTLRVGPAFRAGDSIFVFHDNDPDRASDDVWFGGVVTGVGPMTTCGGNPAQILTVPFVGGTAASLPPDSVRPGAPVRGFDVFTYGQYEIDGESYLGRRARGSADPDPLVGPLPSTRGISFRYLDRMGQVTTVDTLVAQIEMALRYESSLLNFHNDAVSDSVLVRIFPRN